MRACVGRKGGPRLQSRASSCGASQANGYRPFAQSEARKARARSFSPQCTSVQSVGSGQRSTDRTEGVTQRGSGEGSQRLQRMARSQIPRSERRSGTRGPGLGRVLLTLKLGARVPATGHDTGDGSSTIISEAQLAALAISRRKSPPQ